MMATLDPFVADLATLLRCVRCGGRRWQAAGGGLACEGCGHASALRGRVLYVSGPDEDAAVRREREAVLAIETGDVPDDVFTLEALLADRGPLRQAFVSLPYGDGTSTFERYEYFRNVRRFAPVFDYVVDRLGVPSGGRVLDVGADLTWSTSRLAARGWRPVGIDINHHLDAADVLRAHGPDYHVVNVDMHLPAFADGAFDGVTAFNALHHTHRLEPLLANLARVVRPGGRIGIVEPYWVFEANRAAFGCDQIEAGINENVYRLEEWHRWLVQAGFELVTYMISHSFNAVYERRTPARRLSLDEARDELFRDHVAVMLAPPPGLPGAVPAGATIQVPVTIENRSARVGWSGEGQMPALVSYHMLRRGPGGEETMVRFDHARTPLPGFVPPGGRTQVWVPVEVPDVPGDYVAAFDVVYEGQYWWADRGARPGRTLIRAVA